MHQINRLHGCHSIKIRKSDLATNTPPKTKQIFYVAFPPPPGKSVLLVPIHEAPEKTPVLHFPRGSEIVEPLSPGLFGNHFPI
jgi:hypothetical protein